MIRWVNVGLIVAMTGCSTPREGLWSDDVLTVISDTCTAELYPGGYAAGIFAEGGGFSLKHLDHSRFSIAHYANPPVTDQADSDFAVCYPEEGGVFSCAPLDNRIGFSLDTALSYKITRDVTLETSTTMNLDITVGQSCEPLPTEPSGEPNTDCDSTAESFGMTLPCEASFTMVANWTEPFAE